MSTPEYTSKEITRFWSKVNCTDDPDACWEWQAARNKDGYGKVTVRYKALQSHRLAYELSHGAYSPELCVLHRCDNPPCCNPNHLFLGTRLTNAEDRVQKGREADRRGELDGQAKLTPDQVIEIRTRYALGGITQKQLGQEFGVAANYISLIVHRKTWKHL